jgi:uncharacterized membrane protein
MQRRLYETYGLIFIIMGAIYYGIEILWDGSSHWSMFVLGGVCGVLIGLINEFRRTWDMAIWKQVLIGEGIVLPLEFIVGCIVNLWFKLHVWDYSHLPFNILGQTSLLYAIFFLPLIVLAIFLDDYLRYWLFDGAKPIYHL